MSWLTRRPSSDSGFRPSDPSRALPERSGLSLPSVTGPSEFNDLKFQIYEQLLQELDFELVQSLESSNLRKAVEDAAATLIAAREVPLTRIDRLRLVQEVGDEILGLGPLEPLIADPSVTEIMVNGPRQVYVEREGRLKATTTTFRDNAHVMRIIERIIAPLGRRIDEASPMVDARLLDGSRVNAVIPPLAVDGPGLTIRKFAREALQVEDLIRFGSLTAHVATFLEGCVRGKINIVVSGGTGSGKTTLLNVLSAFIPSNERLVTIEDPCELQIRQPHIMRLETRSANVEGRGEITQRQLVRNALRMRPDRIIVGEVRGGEAFDMLQAMNTGHDGSLTTVHSNSPRDALARIENMVLMADLALPSRAIREQVASAINLIIQLSRMRDGSRRVTYVTEVTGMDLHESLAVRDIFTFRYDRTEIDAPISGQLEPTGYRPKILEKCLAEGVELSPDLFGPIALTSLDDLINAPVPGMVSVPTPTARRVLRRPGPPKSRRVARRRLTPTTTAPRI